MQEIARALKEEVSKTHIPSDTYNPDMDYNLDRFGSIILRIGLVIGAITCSHLALGGFTEVPLNVPARTPPFIPRLF